MAILKEIQLLKDLTKQVEEHLITSKKLNSTMDKLVLTLTLLVRIKKRYRYIFEECITDEEFRKICEK